MIEVKRKKGESFEAFLRRFKKRVLESKVIVRAQEKRFRQPQINKNKVRQIALRRLKNQKKREYLQKIGRLKENDAYKKF